MITIVGGGVGGLMLARILHLHDVPVEVLEADASENARHQGGMLDMHEDSGQAALRAAGLHEQFLRRVLENGDAHRVLDKNATVLISQTGDGARPEIGRGALRELLVSSLPEGMIRWGSPVAAVRADAGGFEVRLQDGATLRSSILIGADGAWSKTRALLTPAAPIYSGLTFVEARIVHARRKHPELADLVGNGLMFALSDRRGIIAHREPSDEICAYAAFRAPLAWHSGHVAIESVLEQFSGWAPVLRELIASCDGPLITRALHALPVGLRWERVPGVTLLGDAAHLMSPFAGEGANLALQDGATLAQAIIQSRDDIEAAFARYEADMFARSAMAAAESAASLESCFGPDAPRALVEFFAQHPG